MKRRYVTPGIRCFELACAKLLAASSFDVSIDSSQEVDATTSYSSSKEPADYWGGNDWD